MPSDMNTDPWLERWIGTLREHAGESPVLEIGCGSGADTTTLVAAGLAVTGFDRSDEAVAEARQRAAGARLNVQDVREPFPLEGSGLGAIVASLSLHYFPWTETREIVDRIHRTLRPGGLFLCRLNSTQDQHFGACGNPLIEPGLFLVDGQPKRFFDAPALDRLFAKGWHRLSCEHHLTDKYARPKALWEVVLERAA